MRAAFAIVFALPGATLPGSAGLARLTKSAAPRACAAIVGTAVPVTGQPFLPARLAPQENRHARKISRVFQPCRRTRRHAAAGYRARTGHGVCGRIPEECTR